MYSSWDLDFGEIVSTGLGGSASTIGLVTLEESSVEFGSGGLGENLGSSSESGGDSSSAAADSTGEMTSGVSEAGGPIAGTTVLGGAAGSAYAATTMAPSTSEGPIIEGPNGPVMWEDSSGNIHTAGGNNTVPYPRVEKRAQQIYDKLHGENADTYTFPAIILRDSAAVDGFADIFGTQPSPGKILETLELLEAILQ